MAITCSTCDQDIDCRIGYSNRKIQPISFACLHCDSQLEITLDTSDAPQSKFSYKACRPSDHQPHGPFEGKNPFIDLHLDFPVRFGKYEMGRTPFLVAVGEIEKAAGNDSKLAHAMLQSFNMKLEILNELCDEVDEVKRLINLYCGKNKQLFQKRAALFLGREENQSLLPQDVNATLYMVLGRTFFPFTTFGEWKEISEKMPGFLYELDRKALDQFISYLEDSGFLSTLHHDCLKLYPRIFSAELLFRPALFLGKV